MWKIDQTFELVVFITSDARSQCTSLTGAMFHDISLAASETHFMFSRGVVICR
jgi:hypothetical protein